MTGNPADPIEDLLGRASLMFGVADKAARIWRLGEWALLHRVQDRSSRGPNPVRFIPDKGSSLALDDLGFEVEIAGVEPHIEGKDALADDSIFRHSGFLNIRIDTLKYFQRRET